MRVKVAVGITTWTDVLTGTSTDGNAPLLSRVLARYPVALLVRSA